MEIQESHHNWHKSWSETDINPRSNRVRYNGPLSGPITSNTFEDALHFLLEKGCSLIMKRLGDVTYEAESPDEKAFLVAAREFGFEFCKRTQSSVFIHEIYHSSGQPTQR
ncbi:hypothetical protein Patl1_26078 [Pistacia atlantica]|uniref:Uncharacterized protein n=1 Tax=Pistacia atlantica TaxID=434234 RepID=A0ACC1AZE0_9ROSI|nr:hypothetical protein Patl1_26078 [Pistacia atlantica]